MNHLFTILFGFILLTKPDGGKVWLAESAIVAVICQCHVGATNTSVVTLNGTFYVRETPEEVIAKIHGGSN
jgi:uncharacterized protein YlzI (FlbEa/FlbD family)